MLNKIKNFISAYRNNYKAKKRKKRLSEVMDESRIAHLKPQLNNNHKWYGSSYGGFYIHPDELNSHSIIYSFGIGKDITFDLKCIREHRCQVFGFDPTPKSIEWIASQKLNPKFHFYNYGIALESGEQDFYLPANKNWVSGSLVVHEAINTESTIKVKMKSFNDIIKELGHAKVDVVKIDIEGAEYEILESIAKSPVGVRQILVEFHDRLFGENEEKSKKAVNLMSKFNYRIFAASDTFEEISFIKV